MGREVKRIAKDFNWPLGKTWYGYLSPYKHFDCPACDGSGYNPETRKLIEQEDVQVLIDANCVKAKAIRLGIYGHCVLCGGEGELWHNNGIKEAAKRWEKVEPPAGGGYQLWETCSEGSPISPVFESMDELCDWAADNATTFADCKVSAEEWKKMLADDFVYHKEGNAIFM